MGPKNPAKFLPHFPPQNQKEITDELLQGRRESFWQNGFAWIFIFAMAKLANRMGDPHGDPQASPQHANPHGFLAWFSFKRPQVHVDGRVVGWSAGRHVDHPCGWQISPWPARKVTDFGPPDVFADFVAGCLLLIIVGKSAQKNLQENPRQNPLKFIYDKNSRQRLSAEGAGQNSGTDMTGRPGCRTMEMIGGSSAQYLACTPCVSWFCTLFNRSGNRSAFRLSGAGGGSFPLYGGTFARSYSVSKNMN